MDKYAHSVRLDTDKCLGCMNCIKRCPTEAIRVRKGKAKMIHERCIDCGECIRVCPHHAKYAERESLTSIVNYKYRIALPAPALYGQFANLDDINIVLNVLKRMGFDEVAEVSKGAELVSHATRKLMAAGAFRKPVISSACPVVCRLIRISFPELIPNVVNLNAPFEEAARLAREKAMKEQNLNAEDIGVFFITPCPAKITAIKQPLFSEKSNLDGAVAISDIYPVMLQQMKKVTEIENIQHSGRIGVGWAVSGGEASALLLDNSLHVDGIENVIKILEEIEDEKLNNVDFIELNACTEGCVGGCLTAENPYIAKNRLQTLKKYLPVACNRIGDDSVPHEMFWEKPLEELPVMRLSGNIVDAMRMMNDIKEIQKMLPNLDCGTCGAPSCKALAEDVVKGYASIDDCMFLLRKKLDEKDMEDLIPAPFQKEQ
ncbi:MAG: 4Fe-4S dicluster domain-containing protein [Ruminococcaceae bacterium]|nr:4Fe-4S dicluster domain-containing protein [Oscillospiraceae bacterium]